MTFEIIGGTATHNARTVYDFYFSGTKIVLDRYAEQTRESSRHKWRTARYYQRVGRNMSAGHAIPAHTVTIPAEIERRAKGYITDRLEVTKSF